MLTTIVDRSLSAENIKKVTAHGPMNVVLVIIYMPFEPDEKVKVMRKYLSANNMKKVVAHMVSQVSHKGRLHVSQRYLLQKSKVSAEAILIYIRSFRI